MERVELNTKKDNDMIVRMKALSVKQPYANLIVFGHKTMEVRSRQTKYRGDVLICSTRDVLPVSYRPDESVGLMYFPRGKAVGIVEVVGCRPMALSDQKSSWVKYGVGLWVWELANPRLVSPFPVAGNLGFFNVKFHDFMIINK